MQETEPMFEGRNGMLTQRAKNKIVDETNTAFDAVGRKMPYRSKLNREPAAWEYFVAALLKTRAEARLKQAKEAAIEAGVIFDDDIEELRREPGNYGNIYTGDNVQVSLIVVKPRVVLDQKLLVYELTKRGVKKEVIGAALAAASTETKPGHRFSASLIAKELDETGK